jgi:hypothetical protein
MTADVGDRAALNVGGKIGNVRWPTPGGHGGTAEKVVDVITFRLSDAAGGGSIGCDQRLGEARVAGLHLR